METAIKYKQICNPFEPLIGADEPDEMQELNLRLYQVWKVWERYGTNRDWEKDFDSISLDLLQSTCSWYEVGLVSYKIKIQKSYSQTYQSFREFCERGLQKTAACVNNWIRAANVLTDLISRGFDILPLSCSVALELSKIKTDMGDVWKTLLDRFPVHQITAKTVKEFALDPLREKPKMKTFKIPESQWDKIQVVASQACISPSRMIERILNHYLGDKRDEPESPAATGEVQKPEAPAKVSKEPEITEPKSNKLSPIHVASDLKEREEKAARTIRQMREDYLKNPIRRRMPLPGSKPDCIECGSDRDLIGCMNLTNLSQIPNFWYCRNHIEDSGYCSGCGRYGGQCACDF